MEQQSQAVPPAPQVMPPAPPNMPPAPPVAPPAPQPSGWVMPATVAAPPRSVSGLAKVGALILFLMGLFWSLIGLLAIVAGEFARSFFQNVAIEGVQEGQAGNIVGGAIAVVGIIILIVAILELAVGIFSWRGSGFARVMGILYGLFFGGLLLLSASGAMRADAGADAARGGLIVLAMAIAYLYTAVVFIVRYRG